MHLYCNMATLHAVSALFGYSVPMGALLSPYCWATYTIVTLFCWNCCTQFCYGTIHRLESNLAYERCTKTKKKTILVSVKFYKSLLMFFPCSIIQSPVSPISPHPWGQCCPQITQRAMGIIWTVCGWLSLNLAQGYTWPSMTLTWSLPMTSSQSKMGIIQKQQCWDVFQVRKFLHTSRPTATFCSWSFRLTIQCQEEASTSPTAVSDILF